MVESAVQVGLEDDRKEETTMKIQVKMASENRKKVSNKSSLSGY